MEVGESSAARLSEEEIWAKLVPSDSRYSEVNIRSDEILVCSEIRSSSADKQEWCKISRNSDLCTATMQNVSSHTILVNETVVHDEDTIVIKCGTEIIPGPDREGYLGYRFKDILETDSSLKRSDEEVALLDCYAMIRSNLVIRSGKSLPRKRAHLLVDEESDDIDLPCPQCGTGLEGFHCNQNTVHLQCQACGGMMPSRTDISVPQHCLGCDRAFCGAYWNAQRLTRSNFHPVCSSETFKLISDCSISRIPEAVHEKNQHEQDITKRCIIRMGRTLQDVVSDWIAKFNNREIDRTRMPLNHAEMITAATYICNDCYDKLVSFLLYWFRISMPKDLLPPDASKREDCWYGYACRTQHHNEDHARKRNHVCRPTRGINM